MANFIDASGIKSSATPIVLKILAASSALFTALNALTTSSTFPPKGRKSSPVIPRIKKPEAALAAAPSNPNFSAISVPAAILLSKLGTGSSPNKNLAVFSKPGTLAKSDGASCSIFGLPSSWSNRLDISTPTLAGCLIISLPMVLAI